MPESPEMIRNVALVGHGESGKTTLAESLLFTAGAIKKRGDVDKGTTVMDYDEDEISRKSSVFMSVANLKWKGVHVNLMDTPGQANFFNDGRGALRVCGGAVLLLNGTKGIQGLAERSWAWLKDLDVPVIIGINRLDMEEAKFYEHLGTIQDQFGRGAMPINLPLGLGDKFDGIVNLITMKAHRYATDGSGKSTEEDIPEELMERAKAYRIKIEELACEMDDALMEHYFETGDLTQDEFIQGIHDGVKARKIFPVMALCGEKNIGTGNLLNRLREFIPSPAERPTHVTNREDGELISFDANPEADPALFVFKTISDPYAGRHSLFKVLEGTVKKDQVLRNHRTNHDERLGHLYLVNGKEHSEVERLVAGDIGMVLKLKDTKTGDVLHSKDHDVDFPAVHYPPPSILFSIKPKSKSDEDKLGPALERIREEDMALDIHRDRDTGELLMGGPGILHVETMVRRLERRYGVHVEMHTPKVPYRETIKGFADIHARHKKQSGGHGQFADIKIKMEALPQGGDFEFVNKVFGGSVPRNYIPAVEKGFIEARDKGVLGGFKTVDFKVTLYDGQHHNVDSSEMAFKIAAHNAFKDAMAKAHPVLLEPVMHVHVQVPEENLGDVMGDFNSRRGKILGMNADQGRQDVEAHVPLAEMLNYAPHLKSMVGDRGEFTMEYSHYDEVPAHLTKTILAESQKENK